MYLMFEIPVWQQLFAVPIARVRASRARVTGEPESRRQGARPRDQMIYGLVQPGKPHRT